MSSNKIAEINSAYPAFDTAEIIQTKDDLVKSDVYDSYIRWVCQPHSQRNPATQEEFCAQNGVTRETLRQWREREHFLKDVEMQARRWLATNVDYIATMQGNLDNPKMFQQFRELVFPRNDAPAQPTILNIETMTMNQITQQVGKLELMNIDDDE